ncbi:hypothetical protein T484DRAFT_3115254 [Baffinella frigidus]|nr:hypothetical protein T484DRAFT_3115254 [Cryptophyta sp. CCMP2293]
MQASSNVHLFVEILNRYLFYFEANNDKVSPNPETLLNPRNPKHGTRNLKPKTRDPKPETRNPIPETLLKLKPETRDPKPEALLDPKTEM